MSKKNVKTKAKNIIQCQCSVCEQVAVAQEGSQHFYCCGFKLSIIAQMPPLFRNIKHPNRKGTWIKFVPVSKVAQAIAGEVAA